MRVTIATLSCLMASTALAQVRPTPNTPDNREMTPPPIAAPAEPRDTSGQAGTAKAKPSSADEQFLNDAARASLSEINLGQLAVQKSTTPQIRKLAQTMIDDHQKVSDRLQSIASRQGFTLPTRLTSDQQAAYDRLSALTGSDFDSAFLDQLKSDHSQAISLFQDEAKNGRDPQLKSLAQSTLPSLRHHQQMATRPIRKL